MNFKNLIFGAILMTVGLVIMRPGWAEDWNIPNRNSPRPETTMGVPHVQLNVETKPALTAELLQRVANIPNVEIRKTVISLPGTKGFWLNDELPLARPDAIVGGREFAHMHPDGSLHASLPEHTAELAVEAGWAIKHPWADKRPGWSGFVMIYTMQSKEELDVVFQLILASYNFITGENVTASNN